MAKTPSTSAKTAAAPKKPAAKKPAASKAAPKAAAPGSEAKEKFAKAIEEAKAGVQALTSQAQDKAGEYRQKAASQSEALMGDAKEYGVQAKEKAAELARDGKSKASEAISGLGQIVADTAPTIDEKLGAKYGDYARTAARTMQESAAKLEAKDLGELGNDAKEFVKKSPGLAVGIAAVAGFFFARLFRGSSNNDS